MYNRKQQQQYNALWWECNALYEDWAKRRGLSYHELAVISTLAGQGGTCTQKEICRQWLLPKQTVNSILKRFASRGWTSFSLSQEDRRSKIISLTEAGSRYMRPIVEALEKHETAVWEALGKDRAAALLESTALYNRLFREVETDECP